MKIILIGLFVLLVMGCSKDHYTVSKLELERFMGDWYVIAILPNFIEKDAYNAIESYRLNADSTIAITYKFRKGSPEGKEKVLRPKARIHNWDSFAEWRVQLFKPFWSPYLVIDLADDYRYTVIGVPNRKFVWIMSRTPAMTEQDYNSVLARLELRGYKIHKIVKIPQVW